MPKPTEEKEKELLKLTIKQDFRFEGGDYKPWLIDLDGGMNSGYPTDQIDELLDDLVEEGKIVKSKTYRAEIGVKVVDYS